MKELLFVPHLGAGDGLICNAIARHLARDAYITVLCKPHNAKTLAFQWRDNDRITIIDVVDDDQAKRAIQEVRKHAKKVVGLGVFSDKKFQPCYEFDRVFYESVGLDHRTRWNDFKCARQESRELDVPSGKYCFVHDDFERNIVIPPEALPLRKLKVVRPDKTLKNKEGDTTILFDYWGWLDNAEEIHCVDSSFAIMIDHLHLEKFGKKRLVLHLGLRPNEYPPARLKEWEVVRHNKFATT